MQRDVTCRNNNVCVCAKEMKCLTMTFSERGAGPVNPDVSAECVCMCVYNCIVCVCACVEVCLSFSLSLQGDTKSADWSSVC